ncbi:MAG: FkbM family methyltransferase [Acidobacteria bacterium]|nr:FkbM family methyltransferase [Acidobacteriota bacterium]
MLGTPFESEFQLQSGTRLHLRPMDSKDYATAYEIFCHEYYRPNRLLDRSKVRTVVDLGANVGFASLYFATVFPSAHIWSFEPHPVYFSQLAHQVRRNEISKRVTLLNAAAGTRNMYCRISDEGRNSTIGGSSTENSFGACMLDLFELAGPLAPLDYLKMDIEGGEHALLADPRFESLGIAEIAMEWHDTPEVKNAKLACVERLSGLGYQIEIREDCGGYGTLVASRPS